MQSKKCQVSILVLKILTMLRVLHHTITSLGTSPLPSNSYREKCLQACIKLDICNNNSFVLHAIFSNYFMQYKTRIVQYNIPKDISTFC